MGATVKLQARRGFFATPEQIWQVLADTDRLNRNVGLPTVHFGQVVRTAQGYEVPAQAKLLGYFRIRWLELPFEWQRGEHFSVYRRIENGPITGVHTVFSIHALASGSEVVIDVELILRSVFWRPLVELIFSRYIRKPLDYLEKILTHPTGPARHHQTLPAVSTALERRLTRLAADPVDPALLDRLRSYLLHAADEEVARIRPYLLAEQWQAPKAEVLTLGLYATLRGVLTMEYAVLCPYCRATSASSHNLSEVSRSRHCDFCEISYDGILDRNVEVFFAVHPAIRKARLQTHCIAGPESSPHVISQIRVLPGETRMINVPEVGEPLQLRCLQRNDIVRIARAEAQGSTPGTPEPLTFTASGCDREMALIDLPSSQYPVKNATEHAIVVALERSTWLQTITLASEVICKQPFRNLYSTHLLAPDEKISIANIAILFSDLRASTYLYEKIGDAPAYGRVRVHFDFLREIIEAHHGSVVKTIGDAVMAAFPSALDAIACGLTVQKNIATFNRERQFAPRLTVKLGIHAGPAIVVNTDNNLDYFGRAVNMAARIQKESRGDDVVLHDELTRQPEIYRLIETNGFRLERFKGRLHGFASEVDLVRLHLA